MNAIYFLGLAILATCFAYVSSQVKLSNLGLRGSAYAIGKSVTFGELPYVVLIQGPYGNCTGSIIHQNWVITAAQCVTNMGGYFVSQSDIKIIAGQVQLGNLGLASQYRVARQILVNPAFRNNEIGKGDVALIQVDAFRFNAFVNSIALSSNPWPQDYRKLNRKCSTAGLGQSFPSSSFGIHYLEVIAKHGTNACPCTPPIVVMTDLICTESMRGVCFGNAGGALVCDGQMEGISHVVVDSTTCGFTQSTRTTLYCSSTQDVYMFTCPLLGWISSIVPNTPRKPASCKGAISSPGIASILLGLMLPLINKLYANFRNLSFIY